MHLVSLTYYIINMTSATATSFGFLVVDLARLFRRAFEELVTAEGLGVTAGEARTLLYASRAPGVRQNVLAETMRIEPMTLSNFLDRLEERGLISRTPDTEDRRAKRVSVSEAAGPLLKRIEALAGAVRERATGGLSPGQVASLRHALETMRGNLAATESVSR